MNQPYDFYEDTFDEECIYKHSKKIKIGRTCFSCKFRKKRQGNFIICRYINNRLPIWEKACCKRWQLTNASMRLSHIKKYVEISGSPVDPILRSFHYRNTAPKEKRNQEDQKIVLGRCCFLCEHRGIKKRYHIECSKQSVRWQWEKACCGQFKLTKDWKRLSQYSKYMKQSGVDVRGTLWLR